MWPNGARLLDQLGCLASIEETCSQMTVSYTRNPDGKVIIVSELFDKIVERAAVKDIAESEDEYGYISMMGPTRTVISSLVVMV
ncbi:hypothetical protein N7470_006487 [Penicillium chermesinum]|nr:hypothetical protein N7470_006487 [Penicillium chermesinum]